ncbi:hypothetical protein TrST_g569 [Triparma strigata]|uniref:Uncharacterized protein n=1 Tax=Triparma strigata TaxID=1606541 RepID=A0A9W7BFH5_9STRA|nr:hypothetical protein TrST_g569 [Triparma strigata]
MSSADDDSDFDAIIRVLDKKDANFSQVQRRAIMAKLEEKTSDTKVGKSAVLNGEKEMVRRVEKRRNSLIGTESLEEQEARLKNMDVALIEEKGWENMLERKM